MVSFHIFIIHVLIQQFSFVPQAGFFKSKYKEMINDNAADPGEDGDAVTTD